MSHLQFLSRAHFWGHLVSPNYWTAWRGLKSFKSSKTKRCSWKIYLMSCRTCCILIHKSRLKNIRRKNFLKCKMALNCSCFTLQSCSSYTILMSCIDKILKWVPHLCEVYSIVVLIMQYGKYGNCLLSDSGWACLSLWKPDSTSLDWKKKSFCET